MTGPVLITGARGQVGGALGRAVRQPAVLVGRDRLDFDRPDTLDAVFAETMPSLVINAAAWTAVDAAEAEPEAAARANTDGPARLARLCAQAGIPILHVSTDYVFDGTKPGPYVEADPTSPAGVYGRTKRDGELAVLAANPRALIVRTSWVYAETGRNFVRTMLAAATRHPRLRVVADQIGCPTHAGDLAHALAAVADRLVGGWHDSYAGTYHAAGAGWTSWHGLATAAFEIATGHGRRMPVVEAIRTADWPTAAPRPANSRLACDRLAAVFGLALPPWRPSLAGAVAEICRAEGSA